MDGCLARFARFNPALDARATASAHSSN